MKKTAYELRIIDGSSDVCSSDLDICDQKPGPVARLQARRQGQLPLRAGGQERTHQRDQTGKRALIARIIEGPIANRLFIVLASIVIALAGFWAVRTTPVDALPGLSDVQVVIRSNSPCEDSRLFESQSTSPLTTKKQTV